MTLRRLADRLDARAPSLARHVGGKGKLVALVSATIFIDVLNAIPQGLTGRDWLLAYGRALYAKQRGTRDITALIAGAPSDAETEQMVRDRLDSALADAGLTSDAAMLQQSAVQALVTGWMVFEKARRQQLLARLPQANAFDDALTALVRGFPD